MVTPQRKNRWVLERNISRARFVLWYFFDLSEFCFHFKSFQAFWYNISKKSPHFTTIHPSNHVLYTKCSLETSQHHFSPWGPEVFHLWLALRNPSTSTVISETCDSSACEASANKLEVGNGTTPWNPKANHLQMVVSIGWFPIFT